MHTLFCAFGLDEYSRIKVTHEGTSQVNKCKLGILTLNYATFKMKPEGDIKVMSDIFKIIINEINSYGKTYHNEEVVRKILRSLTKS
ncbi:UBN2 domain-containing protein [Gossypium australe]|uniref:UBN2 domain-containing protein n=1 Tax=Gossypium australe TaxID=47621 RepID=A0A5B6VYP8_9ROSI|nr:UBN2 domain-containing protein [Gossypium australe]